MRNIFPSVFRFPVLCKKFARINNCVLIRSNSAQFNIHSFCQTIISPLYRNRYEVRIINGRAVSLSKSPTPQLKRDCTITNDHQMTGLFNYLIISRIIKLTLPRPETEVNFMLLYLYFIIILVSFLNLFLSMVIHPSASGL